MPLDPDAVTKRMALVTAYQTALEDYSAAIQCWSMRTAQPITLAYLLRQGLPLQDGTQLAKRLPFQIG
jgi:hypothetical protein